MVRDMVSLLHCAGRFAPRYALLRAAVSKDRAAARAVRAELLAAGSDGAALALAARELGGRGRFLPLMPHFPLRAAYGKGYALPWSARDYALADWMAAQGADWQSGGGSGGGDVASGGRDQRRQREQAREGGQVAAGPDGAAAPGGAAAVGAGAGAGARRKRAPSSRSSSSTAAPAPPQLRQGVGGAPAAGEPVV